MPEQATNEEVMKMMQKPCPNCGADMMYYQCHGAAEAEVVGSKLCPVHTTSLLKDCCMKSPETHQMV